MEKSKIRIGQIWRSKVRGHCITVKSRLSGDWWAIKTKGDRTHRMQEHSFHFYELVIPKCQQEAET